MLKKIVALFLTLFLASCGLNQNNTLSVNTHPKIEKLPAISTSATTGVFVSVSDPHIYSHSGPLAVSGSYYFNPMPFYHFKGNLNYFHTAYNSLWNKVKVYYYDENAGAQAGLVVYVLRNYFHLKNVSLLENAKLHSMLKFKQKIFNIPYTSFATGENITGGYIGTGKFLIVYNPKLIKFKTGDLLLYSSDIGTMKEDSFYQNSTGVNIESFDWSKLITINKGLKPKSEIKKLLKPLQLDKYKRVFIYYPHYRYRSGVLALYLQENYSK